MPADKLWYQQHGPTSWIAYKGNQAIWEGWSITNLKEGLKRLGWADFAEFERVQLRIAVFA